MVYYMEKFGFSTRSIMYLGKFSPMMIGKRCIIFYPLWYFILAGWE